MIKGESNMALQFNDLWELIECDKKYVQRMLTPDALSFYHKTETYWKGYWESKVKTFISLKMYCDDYNPATRAVTVTDKALYHDDKIHDELCEILCYKGKEIPVYNDDYGQQIYAVYEGKILPGGAYNFAAELDFCDMIDDIDYDFYRLKAEKKGDNNK